MWNFLLHPIAVIIHHASYCTESYELKKKSLLLSSHCHLLVWCHLHLSRLFLLSQILDRSVTETRFLGSNDGLLLLINTPCH